jgi:hypothetical protein
MLRAVLNRQKIDMTLPCEVWKNNELFGYEVMREKKDQANDGNRISHKSAVETGSEEDIY